MGRAPLTATHVETVEQRGGIYRLFQNNELVYVGKSNGNLRARLLQHMRKVSSRLPPSLASEMSFQCLYVGKDLSAVAPESMLIEHAKGNGAAPWNSNGFGSNDPGRSRDRSAVKAAHFDSNHPINLDVPVQLDPSKIKTTKHLARKLKSELPFNFRYAKDLPSASVSDLQTGAAPAREWFSFLAARLPRRWSIMALHGYVLCYRTGELGDIPAAIGRWSCGPEAGQVEPLTPKVSQEPLTREEQGLSPSDE